MQINKTYTAHRLADINGIAQDILAHIQHKLILFKGELGAGKTTLIKAMIQALDSQDQGSSPSYAIVNEYAVNGDRIYHLDLYRLNDAEEAFQLGIEEILYSGAYCFVEWPQIIKSYLEPPYHLITLEHKENNERKISIV
ncbi:MAG: tRNA (adenosine(37)-N6)-threonylcarbamoyltransferase complex ATPase subunit type 1 TsaE [Saprospiraceae bacterium]|nr:tRNA (adenosine(37)-N6)-threonylcarbamoyltransferase complex ATPase subunit type 1 TsaE [Saprospiraceae bacterium]